MMRKRLGRLRHYERSLAAAVRRDRWRPLSMAATVWLAAAALWWTVSALSGDALAPVRWLNYATPWIGLTLLPAAGWFLLRGERGRAAMAGGMLIIVLGPFWGQIGRSLVPLPEVPAASSLHVMSYNVMTRNKDVDGIAAVIAAQRPELLFLQEVGAPEALSARVREVYGRDPVHILWESGLNLMIVSRYPLEAVEAAGKVQRAVVRAPGGEIALRNLHMVKAGADDVRQSRLMADLIEDIATLYGPVIVAGDFNQTPGNDGYREMRRWLRNTHEEAGRGFGFTFSTPVRRWGALMPLVRIDHMFVSRHFDVLQAERLRDYGGSDHFGISIKLRAAFD